jgi:hypothetical protein
MKNAVFWDVAPWFTLGLHGATSQKTAFFRSGKLHAQLLYPCTDWIGGSVSVRTGLNTVEMRKLLTLSGIKPVQYSAIAIQTELSRLRLL